MKRSFFSFSILAFVLLSSCEIISKEDARVTLLPTNMTATVVMGSSSSKIIADFYYVPDSDLLDHITWSNHQTHYFKYDASAKLQVLSQLKVLEKVQDEYWFSYDGERILEVQMIRRNLDYSSLEPLDSSYTGHIEYEYEGNLVIRETEYGVQKGNQKEYPLRELSYSYDGNGNMLSRVSNDLEAGGEEEITEMTYDSGNHPFSNLKYYFTGESFVNNPLSKSSGVMDFSYDITMNEQNYPERIYEKMGAAHTKIIRYTYMNR